MKKVSAKQVCDGDAKFTVKKITHGGGIPFLQGWKEEGEGIAGEWNGEEPKGEERAMLGKEIAEKCDELLRGHAELQELIEGL